MTQNPEAPITPLDESVALPRSNGALLFAAPWEARAFGVAVALSDAGVYSWRDFSTGLAAETAAVEQHGGQASYYERWLETLEKLALARGLLTRDELEARMVSYALENDDDHHDEE